MKNTIKKINIFAFVLVFSFSGLFVNPASAIVTTNNTFWNGEELVPIDWGNGAYVNEDDDNDSNNDEVSTLNATDIDEDSARLEGEVTNGDNVDVWFVIDNNDSTPSCSDNDIDVSVSGDFDDGDEFSRTISGLESDETYYFRACSDDDSGDVESFTTDDDSNSNDDDNDNGNNSSEDVIAITTSASAVTSSSAYLNGMAIINDGGSADGWFQYGLSTNLGSTTPSQSLGDDGSVNISKQLYGLTPNTAYYFRLVVNNDSGTEYGDIKSLVTSGTSTPTNTNTNTTNTNTTTTTTVVNTNVSLLALTIESNMDTVSIGDTVTFTVAFKNNSGKELKNVIMNVELPEEMVFQKSTLGDFSKSNNSIFVSVVGIPKDVDGEFLVIAEVSKAARGQSVLVASLEGVYDNPSIEGAKLSTLDYSILEVDGGNTNLAAGSAFAGKFFPTSFLGWLLIVGIIFIIILIARKLVKDKEEREEEKQEIKIAK